MAYINVAEWTPDHVAEWLRGLEDSILPYVHFFLNNNIDGHHLLHLSSDDLNSLHIYKVGHQELILEAVELLKQLHYGLTLETLQSLALRLGCKARSLCNDLKIHGPPENLDNRKQERVSTDTLSAVSDILVSVKALISWLDRYPFEYQDQYIRSRKTILKHSIELASTAQRDQFAEKPHSIIKNSSLSIAELCDKIVQEFNDSLIIQPASLDIATIKKKPEEELGMHIQSTYSGMHMIGGIKPQSPAHRCSKVEEGDEIIQINYQTVVGWQLKKLVYAMRENPTEIHLTMKKRPRHTNILGQIIVLRPYRIPSKKTAYGKVHKWSDGNSSLHIQDVYSTSNDSENPSIEQDDDDDDDSAFLPDDSLPLHQVDLSKEGVFQYRVFSTSHATVQRRATVSGASPTVLKPPVNIEDLVNGVPSLMKKDHIGRSISHDPAKLTSPEKNKGGFNNVLLDKGNTESIKENVNPLKDDNMNNNEKEISIRLKNASCDLNFPVRPATAIGLIKVAVDVTECYTKGKIPVTASDVLPLQEEDYTILENKSLKTFQESMPVKSDVPPSNHGKIINENVDFPNNDVKDGSSQSNARKTCMPYPWESADTAFCGRRPSVQDISNEIAGSRFPEAECVLLKKAIKLHSPGYEKDCEPSPQEVKSGVPESYQVVIVAGVPQKCEPILKDGRRGSETFLLQNKKKCRITDRFATRRISCKDLGMGDCQGWLYKRKEGKGFLSSGQHWTKRWIVLKKHYLYSYKDKNDVKAECLIFLPGSTVSPALECKTKKCVFKVCHQTTVFYFATESQEDLTKWMNKMGLAAIAYDATSDVTTSGFLKPEIILGVENNFYSETEDSEEGTPSVLRRNFNPKVHHSSPESSSLSSEQSFPGSFVLSEKKSIPDPISVKEVKTYEMNQQSITKPSGAVVAHKPPKRLSTFSSVNGSMEAQKSSHKTKYDKLQEGKHLRVSCNRSLSCMTNSYSDAFKNIPRKMSYEETALCQSLPVHHGEKGGEVKHLLGSSVSWSSEIDEEYSILTSSLGRQKSHVKECPPPGLVARMAISFSNLNQGNTGHVASAGKQNTHLPSARYVNTAFEPCDKAATNSPRVSKWQPSHSIDSLRKLKFSENIVTKSQFPCSKRSFSESQTPSNENPTFNSRSSSFGTCFPTSSEELSLNSRVIKNESFAQKHVSMLDREYHRLYGKKKSPSICLKSPNSLSTNQESPTAMKFFPSKIFHEKGSDSDINYRNQTDGMSGCSPEKAKHEKYSVLWETEICPKDLDNISETRKADSLTTKDHRQYENISSFGYNVSRFSPQIEKCKTVGLQGSDPPLESVRGIENIGFSYSDNSGKLSPVSDTDVHFSNSIDIYKRRSCCLAEDSRPVYPASKKDVESPKPNSSENSSLKSNSSFRFFGSPKFMKKLNSPKLDKKNIFKSKKLAKELKRAEQKEALATQNERKFLGSPRLARAFFGSPKVQKKVLPITNSFSQAESSAKSEFGNDHLACKEDVFNAPYSATKGSPSNTSMSETPGFVELARSSSTSSFNSDSFSIISNSTTSIHFPHEVRMKSNLSPSLSTCSVIENRMVSPEACRTPLKPTMGIAMLSKRRLPSLSGESYMSSASSKSPQEMSALDPMYADSDEALETTELLDSETKHVLDNLWDAELTLDGVDLRARRCKTMFMPSDSKRVSQLVLGLRALQRTLKDKESELGAIDELFCMPCINHEVILKWMAKNAHVLSNIKS